MQKYIPDFRINVNVSYVQILQGNVERDILDVDVYKRQPKDTYITISFCELSGNKLVTKGTYAKMARGEMVRFLSLIHISSIAKAKEK